LLTGRRVAERNVGVQRRVLEAGRCLDGRDDLPRDAELREAAERRLLGAEVAHGLVQADQALLDQVFRVAASEEVRACLEPDETRQTTSVERCSAASRSSSASAFAPYRTLSGPCVRSSPTPSKTTTPRAPRSATKLARRSTSSRGSSNGPAWSRL